MGSADAIGRHSLIAHDVFWPVQPSICGRAYVRFPWRPTMKPKRLVIAASLITAALTSGAIAQQDDNLGKVNFPASCDPKVQAEFERGMAMLHSYWFNYARRTFEGVLQQDPNCAMAYWGIALDLLGNTLVGPPPRADAQAAWEALEKARAMPPKTEDRKSTRLNSSHANISYA